MYFMLLEPRLENIARLATLIKDEGFSVNIAIICYDASEPNLPITWEASTRRYYNILLSLLRSG